MVRLTLIALSLLVGAGAQRPTNISICDYYSKAILGSVTATSQNLLMTLLVNTFVIGNYTTPNTGVTVAGIAAPAVYNGIDVELLPYFTGAFNSTNHGGDSGVSELFLDNGGGPALAMNTSSKGDVKSAQYNLLNHIYQYFGTLLGCSEQGSAEFPAYEGRTSMYEVHKFMDLDINQMNFFISQVQTSATSLGFATADVQILGNVLNIFNTRCQPANAVHGIAAPAELQSVCIAENCPLDPNADCATYPDNGVAKIPVNITEVSTSNSTSSSTSASSTASGGTPSATTVSASQGVVGKGGFSLLLLTSIIGALIVACFIL